MNSLLASIFQTLLKSLTIDVCYIPWYAMESHAQRPSNIVQFDHIKFSYNELVLNIYVHEVKDPNEKNKSYYSLLQTIQCFYS